MDAVIGLLFGVAIGYLLKDTIVKLLSEAPTSDTRDGSRFLVAQGAINKIDDYLNKREGAEYSYMYHSANEQRNNVLGIIEEYCERVSKI